MKSYSSSKKETLEKEEMNECKPILDYLDEYKNK